LQQSHRGWAKSGQKVFRQSSGNIPQQPLWSQQSLIWRPLSDVTSTGYQQQSLLGRHPLTGWMRHSSIFFRQQLQPQLQRFLLLQQQAINDHTFFSE
jgi:hypothetical protein